MTDRSAAAAPRHVCFVTGRLAEPALRATLERMSPEFAWDVVVLRITVAALMTTSWIARFLRVPDDVDLVVVPGLCEGSLDAIEQATGVRAVKGPKDLREIPAFFGRAATQRDYGAYDIEIVAEINNAPRLARAGIVSLARYYADAGADIVDVGCTPGLPFPHVGDVVRELRDAGLRVSIDSFDASEIREAVDAGAELVLSINGTNLGVAHDLAGTGARVVAIPDFGAGLDSLEPTLAHLDHLGVPYLVDPVVEPIGMGFTTSLVRFAEARRRWPQAELLMGIGNITELTAADSTGVNAVLVGICQELGVRTVLTTEVTPWARGAVREVDVARRLMHHAVARHTIPKHVDDRLVTVKDPAVLAYTDAELRALQRQLTDPNFRIFVDGEAITVLNDVRFVRGTDIQTIFGQLGVDEPTHAFYLGKELAKARIALALGKTYRQEGELSFGYLTPPDEPRREHVRFTHRAARLRPPVPAADGSAGAAP